MTNSRNKRLGNRVRTAACLALRASWTPMSIDELADAISAWGLPLGDNPAKTVADALRWEVERGRIVRVRRGVYAAGRIKRSTEYSMRTRLIAYTADLVSPDAIAAADALAAETAATESATL